MTPIFSARVGGQTGAPGVLGVVEKAIAAEEAGFDQVWTGNDFLGEPGVVALAAIAMRTTRIKFGSGVLDPVSLHPGQIAQIATGLQELSGGRFLLGIGAGSDVYFARAGITPALKAAPRTRQAVVTIRELLAGRSPLGTPYAAEGWSAQAVLRDAHPTPIYVGGLGPRMLAVAGAHADGALSLCLPPRHVRAVTHQIAEANSAAGRTMADFDLAACVWASISDDRAAARRILAAHIAEYSGSLAPAALTANGLDVAEFEHTQSLMDQGRVEEAIDSVTDAMLGLGIVGGVDDVIEQCGQLIDSGVRHISFGPPMGTDPIGALRLIGEKVLPALRAQFDA
ncbi:LLM class flavin-dependent oxidoreductase [Nocardioides nitrophenolicus]|uniref:LLM class flavin-dependent oxidoreductase n=1 Tax=Nocardioides nitrophenolicus TaxID=60489 RepID=UPI001956D6CF|nr:LLM class flavin-dependent oxidoreductase [Nocardioides nitrophenolicus]MBM7518580.1 5,10-methylenetetrahydromethanopterin reductase [Nocardioides nitrophenolicus]